MQFRRVKIEIRHVVGPFIANILASVAILMAWSIVDPWQWERQVVDDVTLETYGECQSENALRFFIPLACLMGISTISCGVMAFKCGDIDTRFSDSNYIFYTIFVQIQVFLVGIPVLAILNNASANATYLSRSLLVFVIVMTTLTMMIFPKTADIFTKRSESFSSRGQRSAGQGSTQIKGMDRIPVDQIPVDQIRLGQSSELSNSVDKRFVSQTSAGEMSTSAVNFTDAEACLQLSNDPEQTAEQATATKNAMTTSGELDGLMISNTN